MCAQLLCGATSSFSRGITFPFSSRKKDVIGTKMHLIRICVWIVVFQGKHIGASIIIGRGSWGNGIFYMRKLISSRRQCTEESDQQYAAEQYGGFCFSWMFHHKNPLFHCLFIVAAEGVCISQKWRGARHSQQQFSISVSLFLRGRFQDLFIAGHFRRFSNFIGKAGRQKD